MVNRAGMAVVAAVLLGCSSDSSGPGPAPVPAAVVVVSGDNQNAVLLEPAAEPLVAQVNDASGRPVAGVTVAWTISGGGSGSTGTAVTDAAGRTSATRVVGGTMGGYTTTVTVPEVSGLALDFVTLGTAVPSGYNVQVQFLTAMTATQRAAFLAAAARWSSIIVGDLLAELVQGGAGECGDNSPAINQTVNDILIFASVAPIDGPGGIIGSAGPCWVRLPGYLTLVGDMTFDAADMAALESTNRLQPVILHEMGHVLGFGTLWDYVTPPLLTFGTTDSTHFNGSTANAYYAAAGGLTAFPSLYPVPVENTGGAGTQDGHWRETVMTNELMTGYLAAGANPLSAITIGSMADLAYTVDYTTADPYSFTAPPTPGSTASGRLENLLPLRELPRTGPIRGIDREGRISRVRLPQSGIAERGGGAAPFPAVPLP
jgi:hypothetical protein